MHSATFWCFAVTYNRTIWHSTSIWQLKLDFNALINSGCSHALFVLSQVVDYFSTHGSTVYMASLDASKAFDRVNHIKLFKMLIDRGLPSHVIKVLIDWYGKIFCAVRWKNSLSCLFSVKSGIRQGGILSPFLFNIYADCLISALRLSDLGCHIGNCYVGCIAYADDLILLHLHNCRWCFNCVTTKLRTLI